MIDKYATGRRKTSVARVYLRQGSGKVFVNKKDVNEYFSRITHQFTATSPLDLVEQKDIFDVHCFVKGGGNTGQAEAVRHGLSRALTEFNSEFRPTLKKAGFLKRDDRIVERKKYGKRGARASYQFSKR